jgi:hypothetical protein
VRNFLDSLNVILALAAFVLLPGLFVFCIVASFTGGEFTDWEGDVAIRLVVVLGAVLFTGRIVSILRGSEGR